MLCLIIGADVEDFFNDAVDEPVASFAPLLTSFNLVSDAVAID
jgi:hypothetical protein